MSYYIEVGEVDGLIGVGGVIPGRRRVPGAGWRRRGDREGAGIAKARGWPGRGLVGRKGGDRRDIEVGRDGGCHLDGQRSGRDGAVPGQLAAG